ncbi:MAG: hypothetical protein KF825_08460 [Ferruginibacter sp.]|nr:hypothetical protein [Ferruginibacter sp.]
MNCKLLMVCLLITFASCNADGQKNISNNPFNSEVMYHVVQRSFYDSNGDMNGDLNGLREKLDYLQDLGVTSILMLPLYESVYYHNYFSGNFEKIDSELGSMQDYLDLVKEIHRRGMKIYMDMETQYVTEDHQWYKDALGNLASPYSDYITYDDSAHKKPSTIVYNLDGLKGFDGNYRKITTVNMNNEKVRDYNIKLFNHWVDPNGDGDFSDGVDGFRLDHMMDDLDNKGRWKNLFQNFWNPLIEKVKAVNSKIVFIAEQANWGSLGIDYLTKTGVDRVFAFRIAFEIRNLNKKKLETMCDSTFGFTPQGKNQIVFIENHDMPRFATVVKQNPGQLRVGAALNLLLGGIPSIYYGQEIGMTGAGGFMKYGMTDANEIPEREAFEWYQTDTGKGMAFWYKNSGPWWDSSNVKPNDGISLQEEKANSNSLWHYYKQLVSYRKMDEAINKGTYLTVKNNNDSVFSCLRILNDKASLIIVNLSSQPATANMDMQAFPFQNKLNLAFGNGNAQKTENNISISLPAYETTVYHLLKSNK